MNSIKINKIKILSFKNIVSQTIDDMLILAEKVKKYKKRKRLQGVPPCKSLGIPPSGKLDTQLFPEWWATHKMKAKASSKINVSFEEKENAQDSLWKIARGNEEASLSIKELFPSGEYNINEVRSKDFGLALALRLSNGSIEKESNKLISENNQKTYDISENVLTEDKVKNIVCNIIPLNDYQKKIRDSLEKKHYEN